MKTNYGKLFNTTNGAHAATSAIYSEELDLEPGADGVTFWARDTVGGVLVPQYLPLGADGADDAAWITLDGTSSDAAALDYRVTLAANVLGRISINHGCKRIRLKFTPAAATAGTIDADGFGTGVKA